MADLGTAYVNIVPKAPGIKNNVEELLGGSGAGEGANKAGSTLGQRLLGGVKTGFKVAGAGIAVGVGAIIKDAFEAGGSLQQSFGGLETIYGESANVMKYFAGNAAAAGISMNDYAEQAVSFGAALKAAYGGDTLNAATAANTAILDMADNAAKMGTPLESIQAAYQGFARGQYQLLDNLKLGYGGTAKEMQRLLADAQAITGVEYDIDNLGDVYDAIHVIQGELGLTGVAASEAETTLSGSAGAMKASWENLMGALATGEGMDTAMKKFSSSVGNFASNVLTILGELAPQLPELVMNLANVIIENAPEFIASGAELIAQLAVGLINSIPDLIAKLPEIWDGIKNAFGEVDWDTIGKSIITGIIKGLDSAVTSLWNWVKDMAKRALQAAKDALAIGSPSKAFADEVGRWIPAGVALGIEQNQDPLDRAMQAMADGSLAMARSDLRPARSASGSDSDRIVAALQNMRFEAVVGLEGDARQLFKVVNKTNMVRTKATNYNALAAGG